MSQGFRAKPVLLILVVNVVFITIAPRVWFEILVEIHRLFSPIVGGAMVTYLQALLTILAGLLWLYVWRESFRRLYRRLTKDLPPSSGPSSSAQ